MKTVLLWIGIIFVGLLSLQLLSGLVSLISAGIQSLAVSVRQRTYRKMLDVAA